MTTNSDAVEADDADYVVADWRRYQALDRLVNHWNRPGWTDGRRSYHWLLPFDRQPAVHALAARCQAQLRNCSTLDLVPLSSLHVTVQRAGFVDELPRTEAEFIAEAVRKRCASVAPLTLQIGPLAGSSGAVRFSAGPREPVHRVLEAVQAAIAEIRGATAVQPNTEVFIPHISIAYNNADLPARPMIERVAALRALGSVTAQVDSLDLVELRREGRAYLWKTLTEVGLG